MMISLKNLTPAFLTSSNQQPTFNKFSAWDACDAFVPLHIDATSKTDSFGSQSELPYKPEYVNNACFTFSIGLDVMILKFYRLLAMFLKLELLIKNL